jgi:prepilin-type N-terminal cleavage/methylation domain-containing protein
MRRGFTLLELIVVIIIIGVLATLGFTQYGTMVERARGAEAKQILGDIRKLAQAFRLQNGALDGSAGGAAIAGVDVNIGASGCIECIPPDCNQTSHYFGYGIAATGANTIVFTATRCGVNTGKNPGSVANTGQTITLTSNFLTGVDTWGGTGPWR